MDKFKIFELLVSSAIFGIIWLVQLLQYPGFLYVDRKNFKQAMTHHQDRISIVILPLMLSELFLGVWLVFNSYSVAHLITLILILLIWVLTFTVQVPIHKNFLKEGFNEERIKYLVKSNWSRTILWTIKLLIILGTAL
jgi:formate hydrogenlyase subunit 4